jgi:hypothetical protein
MAEVTIMQQEALKEHSKLLARMKLDRSKLYGLILEHMSVESKDKVAQEADYETWHKETDPEKLWQAIVKSHKVDCVSNVSQVKELTAQKAYQQIKQGPFESLAQFSEQFRETYRSYKNTSTATNPVNIEEKEQAMDFFHALDTGRYGAFKTSMLNGWAAGAFDPVIPSTRYIGQLAPGLSRYLVEREGQQFHTLPLRKVLNRQQPRRNKNNCENRNSNKQQRLLQRARQPKT